MTSSKSTFICFFMRVSPRISYDIVTKYKTLSCMAFVCLYNAVQSMFKPACGQHSELDQKMEVFPGQKCSHWVRLGQDAVQSAKSQIVLQHHLTDYYWVDDLLWSIILVNQIARRNWFQENWVNFLQLWHYCISDLYLLFHWSLQQSWIPGIQTTCAFDA